MGSFRGLIVLGLATLAITGCVEKQPQKITVQGEAQGTTYSISYMGIKEMQGLKHGIDSTLDALDQSLSTYVPTSLISRYNAGLDSTLTAFNNEHFYRVLDYSWEVYEQSGGLFDPTVAPLVNYWGWGPGEKLVRKEFDSVAIDSLRMLVGLDRVYNVYKKRGLNEGAEMYGKLISGMKLDFNAIAQGYSVDVLYDYMKSRGISDFLIELGGELRACGSKLGEPWTVGIDKPIPHLESRELYAVVELEDKALATSGNYRKFYEIDGKKYAHTISPVTGFPVTHSLLSATVIADECAIADAYATVFMVMGTEAAKQFLRKDNRGLSVMLIFDNGQGKLETWHTADFKMKLLENTQEAN